jgi:hypothetical protein
MVQLSTVIKINVGLRSSLRAIAALKEIGILTGLRIERSERGAPHEFALRTTEELVVELAQLGIKVEIDAAGEMDEPPSSAMN